MPLVRIDLRRGTDADYRRKIGEVVYEGLLAVGVPAKDRFQIITEHDEDGLCSTQTISISRAAMSWS